MENIFSLERPGIGFNIVYAVVETVLFFAILWALEVSTPTECVQYATHLTFSSARTHREQNKPT